MNYLINFIISLSILFAVIIGIARFKKIDKAWYPFIYRVCLVLLVEILRRFFIVRQDTHTASAILNIFSFFDFYLLTLFFNNWGLFGNGKKMFNVILIIFGLAWIVITFFISGFTAANLYFRILYSFALVFFSVSMLNGLIVRERGNILKNPLFLVCVGIIIFFTLFILVCVTQLSLFRQNVSRGFRQNLQEIISYTNLFVNLIYALALLWIPRKKNFTSLF
jgi:hypothetical protein